MVAKVLSVPPVGSDIDLVVDWLEFEAFFSAFDQASIDDVISSQNLQIDDVEEDIAKKDRVEDELRTSIETEIRFRSNALGAAYPFAISDDGEQVTFAGPDNLDAASNIYLVCLILSHVTRSPILAEPPNDKLVRLARKRLFQIIATLAAAGHARGGAVSLGWPREKKESIIDVVGRAAAGSGTGEARIAPHELEPKGAKDGGLDVLAWTPAVDGPPPELFYFVQAASGHNWVNKSAKDDHGQFMHCYYSAGPTCNLVFLTVCPFRVSEDQKKYQQLSHGTISDRTRAPIMAMAALEAAAAGHALIDEVSNIAVISKWLTRYRREHRRAP